jgi:hypothetical protein
MAGEPLLSGDDVVCRLFVNQDKFGEDILVSADVKPNTSKYRDDHLGNRFSRTDMRLWGWDISLKAHYSTDALLKAMLAFYTALSTPGTIVPQLAIMLAVQERAGAALAPGYLFTGVVADYDLGLPGMKERLMQGLECWAEKVKPFKAA